jgi:lipopolysaccharide transport system permease protein
MGAYLQRIALSRHVMHAFARRNVMGKIAQTRLGVLVILLQAIVLTLVIGFVIQRSVSFDAGYPYLLFLLPGMCGWYVFSYLVSFSGMSLIQNQGIITKVAFPRIALPLSFGISVLVDVCAWMLVMAVMMVYFGYVPGYFILLLPLFVFMNIITGLTVGMWLAVLSVRTRDLVLVVPLFMGLGIFLTPVFYPVSLMPGWLGNIMYLNPLAGVVEGYRYCFVSAPFDISYLWGFAVSILLFAGSVYVFNRKEGTLADYL